MDGRGRKSAASLAVVTPLPGQRPEPPEGLSDAESAVWRSVVATKPSDWFTADTFPLLVEYCRASIAAQQTAAALEKYTTVPTGPTKFARFLALRKLQDTQGRLLATLATKMRLAQQSKYGARGADGAARRGAQGEKPWEFGKSA